MLASRLGKLDKVKLLVEEKGADVNRKSRVCVSKTDLHNSPTHVPQFQVQIEKFPVEAAVSGGNVECLKYLMQKGAEVNPIGTNDLGPLGCAATSGHLDCMKLLLEAAADVNQDKQIYTKPLKYAVVSGNTECVRLLLAAGADVNSVWYSVLNNKDTSCLKLLLEAGANVDLTTGNHPLQIVAREGKEDFVKMLLEHGAPVNFQDIKGQTPLTSAAANGHLGCVQLLLDAGADVNLSDNFHGSPLMLAGQYSNTRFAQCVKLLLESGANVNHIDNSGATALEQIASRDLRDRPKLDWTQQEAVVKLLLSAGAKVNMTHKITVHDPSAGEKREPVLLLIFAAGEETLMFRTTDNSTTETQFYPPGWEDLDLSNQCRKVIRKHLLTLDPHTNLYMRIPLLEMTNERPGIPDYLVSFLLFGPNLNVDWEQLEEKHE